MVDTITVDSDLADQVEKEIYAPLKPSWSYYHNTTEYYSKFASPEERARIDLLASKYGPVNDTQRFTYTVYCQDIKDYSKPFYEIRNDPNSFYRKKFQALPKLVDYLQFTYIPSNYFMHRFIINMQTIRPQWSMNAIHPDVLDNNGITILYYVNNSDGDTYFFDQDSCIRRVPPVKGTAAMYPSYTYHAGSTPTQHETRSVINLVFLPQRKGGRAV